ERLLETVAADGGDVPFEDVVDFVHPALHEFALVGGKNSRRAEERSVNAAIVFFPIDSDFVPHVGGREFACDDADRAGDRGGVGKNRVCATRDIVATAPGDIAHRDDQRLFGFHALGSVENDFAGGGRTAGGIDPQDDSLDRVVGRGL